MSRSGRVIRAMVVGAVVVFAGAASGCATEVPSRSELVAAFEGSGLSADLAGCVTDAVLENLPDEDLIRLVERGSGAGPQDDPDRDDDSYDRTRAALTACQETAAATSTTTTTTTTTTTAAVPPSDATPDNAATDPTGVGSEDPTTTEG
jgi:hypothetical protein